MVIKRKDASNTCYACFHLFLFFKLQWIGKLVIIIKLIQYWLIGWFMFGRLTLPWQIFNTYWGNNKITELQTILQSGRERNSLTYKYYIEIQTVHIFTWQFSIERVSISVTLKVLCKDCRLRTGNCHWKLSPVSSLYQYIVGLHDKIYLYKDVLISSSFS